MLTEIIFLKKNNYFLSTQGSEKGGSAYILHFCKSQCWSVSLEARWIFTLASVFVLFWLP